MATHPLAWGRALARGAALVALCAGSLLPCAFAPRHALHASPSAYVRLNQIGYINGESKRAILMASGPETGATFTVVTEPGGQTVYSAPIGPSQGAWSSAFPNTYLLDFSSVTTTGSYAIQVAGPVPAASPTFSVDTAAHLYSAALANAEFFYQAQHDGPNVNPAVMNRQPSHLTDEHAGIYLTPRYINDVLQGTLHLIGGPIDASGGWFDAGDYIKLVETASYANAIMLLAVRQYPALTSGDGANFAVEGKYELDWLQKMWDNAHETLYYQVGIGDEWQEHPGRS